MYKYNRLLLDNNIICFVLLILLSCTIFNNNVQQVNGFNIVSNTIKHKSANILGTEMDMAVMEVEFDRDLYYHMDVVCPNYTCPSVVPQGGLDCSCDYTDPLDCPRTVSGDPSCPPCPLDFVSSSGKVTSYCNPNYDWTTIQLNTKYDFQLDSITYLRLKANASSCQGIRFYLSRNDEVHVSFFVSPYPSLSQYRAGFGDGLTQVGICPSDGIIRDDWTNNTYTILIDPIPPAGKLASFSFIAYSTEVPPLLPITNPCTNILSTHTCINDGEPIDGTGNDMEYFHYTFTVDRPMNLSFGLPSLEQGIDVYISDTDQLIFPDMTNYIYSFAATYDDFNTIPMEPNSDGTPKILYISLLTYYATSFRFTVTSYTTPILLPLIGESSLGGSNLLGTVSADLILPDGTVVQNYEWANAANFYFVFPRQFLNPFWPLPPILAIDDQHVNFFRELHYSNENLPKSNTYQAAYLLQKNEQQYMDFETIANATLRFNRGLVDIQGRPLIANVTFVIQSPPCNYTQLGQVKGELEGYQVQLFNLTQFEDVSTIRFAIDILTFDDSWVGCSGLADNLLETVVVDIESNTTSCPYSPLDPRYKEDPCCSSVQNFYQCCLPRVLSIPTTTYSGVEKSSISDQCSSPACTESVLQDYFNATMSISDECSLTYSSFSGYQMEIYTTLRQCKNIYNPIHCNNDTMCYNSQYTCNLYSRTCDIPVDVQDLQYFSCVINNLSPKVNYFLQSKFNISFGIYDAEFVQELIQIFMADDCTGSTGLDYRKYQTYGYGDYYTQCYPSPICYDVSCQTVHDICYDGYFGGFYFSEESSIDYCTDIGLCSDGSCDYYQDSDCITSCQSQPQFCGYCMNNGTSCHNLNSIITTESDCNLTTSICLLKDGQFAIGVTDDECRTTQGSCSSYCGYECTGTYLGCYLPLITSEADCLAQSNGSITTSWYDPTSLCNIPSLTEDQCSNVIDAEWLNCTSKPTSECYSGAANQCQVSGIECKTQPECETIGGECSDTYFFTAPATPLYPDFLGKCVRPHQLYRDTWAFPTCLEDVERDSPRGCYSIEPQVFTQQDCHDLGDEYEWWVPSLNQDTCLSQMGCQVIDSGPYNLPNNYRFNEMNESVCNGCHSDGEHNWINMYDWKKGVWSPGTPVKPTWLTPEYRHTAEIKPVLDHNAFSLVLEDAYYTHISDLLRSTSLCRIERIEDSLNSIACSCSGPGGSQCFSSSSLILGQSNPCSNEESEFKFSFGKILFSKSSVPQACTNVVVSQLSKQLFKSTQRETLSSNFVSYKKPDSFAIYNDNEAVIGVVLTDGIKIQSPGVKKYTVCFIIGTQEESSLSSSSSDYPILDIATELNEDEPGKLVVMETNITKSIDEKTQDIYYCSEINVATMGVDSSTYFLVRRVEDYEDLPRQVFDTQATALLYTLAAIFLFNTSWGTLQILVSFYKYKTDKEEPRLVHILITSLTAFMLIRTIYFFLLARGNELSAVGDYILVVLPTFIYFTCFSIIIIIWYMLVKTIASRGIFQRIRSMIAAVNGILYILFIAIVLIYHFTRAKDTNNDCGGRIPMEPNTTTPQRIVSIVYAVVQAVISLIIGAAFAYLGGTIYFMMKRKKVAMDHKRRSQQQKKVSTITLACSIGFILHCVFVLVLVGAEPNNILFTFVGLIVTEIAPVFTLLYSYKKGTLSGIKDASRRFSMSRSMKNISPPNSDTTFTSSMSSKSTVSINSASLSTSTSGSSSSSGSGGGGGGH